MLFQLKGSGCFRKGDETQPCLLFPWRSGCQPSVFFVLPRASQAHKDKLIQGALASFMGHSLLLQIDYELPSHKHKICKGGPFSDSMFAFGRVVGQSLVHRLPSWLRPPPHSSNFHRLRAVVLATKKRQCIQPDPVFQPQPVS